ncbi:RecQ family ATP-dependent DNA helicase [Vibrio sp. Of7-15]|uniref:RecQ family ATP-dependent DNA helicase n=1 Tax=Vibrio sp. Of7-15 TaxID=2724879 RepID=UPI001EF1CE35|nr:RecQ family ATP-dependent DNA helicase [Vibrio sp. Of7-15]MCG7495705.1 RecQ family ATP-dependent DNA helicase [Vibrio sp. Of7-15]
MLNQILKEHFGFDQLRTGQQEVIEKILSGQSTAAIFPTGSGKSLCYQLPATQLPHLTLVISPLLALMKDQLDFLHSKNIPAASIDSSQTWDESQQVMRSVREGELKVLMISVERLKNERFRSFISQVPISLLVVDEAHCISEWGHNFRPDYLKLSHYQKELNIPQVLLLTATATTKVISDMSEKFAIKKDNIVVTGFYRSNLDLTVEAVPEDERLERLSSLLLHDHQLPSIVYVTLQHTAEEVAEHLQSLGLKVQAYHAGMDSEKRQQIQAEFMAGEHHCIVATIAFGMGIDKSDIRRVIHFDLPKSIENYSQEIGRAGRDGNNSTCTVLANKDNLTVLENFVYGDTPDQEAIQELLNEISAVETVNGRSLWEVILVRLSNHTNIRQLPLKTLLVYLEMRGIITPAYSYFAEYKFKFLVEPQVILKHFEGERLQFVSAVFQASKQAKVWCTPDFDVIWQTYGADRQRVIASLDFFHEKGWIALETKLMTEVYHVNQRPNQVYNLASDLHQLFTQKEDNEINRIANLIDFFESTSCLSAKLASYFGDNNAPQQCDHCSVCRGKNVQLPNSYEGLTINPNLLQVWLQPFIAAFHKETHVVPSYKAQTRFLCGITFPMATKVRARKMEGFGQLERLPFKQVLEQLTNNGEQHNIYQPPF